MQRFSNKLVLAGAALLGLLLSLAPIQMASASSWSEITQAAKGQSVYFNAWGGDDKINDYIQWAAKRLKSEHNITLTHVKLSDTSAAVARILAEKTAGRTSDGSVDLLWVNGENFAAMKRADLLQADSWVFDLPSWQFTDTTELPGLISDFAEPTDGRESPWGRAQLVFAYDTAITATPPQNPAELMAYIKANPGRFTFPQPPDFVGVSFLKQIALELSAQDPALFKPASEEAAARVLAPLWAWLDEAQPHFWRGGRSYPADYPSLRQLLGDGEIDIAVSFNPADASNAIASGDLPETVRTYIHQNGTLANIHFLAIPFNAQAPEAARLVADFMLSPEAQIKKADPTIWGDPTVLSYAKLSARDKAAMDSLPRGVATLSAAELNATLPEPHPSWVKVLEQGWASRYGAGR
ncbi:MAG: ABC transporter substrate-binding protein [Candidatus Puniceispirillaceae bacterium]